MNARPAAPTASLTVQLGWAVYLACSWTWCIGMYLPIVLRDHYGWPGVIAFALPNIAGVVLFGIAVGTASISRALIARHGGVMAWFSLITIAFHVYFLAAVWGYEREGASWVAGLLVPVPIVALAWLARPLCDQTLRRLALFVYATSLAMLGASAVIHLSDSTEAASRTAVWAERAPSGVVFLAPLFALGFLTCPSMDLTFHRALEGVGGERAGRTTFALFSALFAVMIASTALYSVTGLRWPVIVHILIQSWFTMTLHWREIDCHGGGESLRAARRWLRPVLLVSLLLAPLPFVDYRWWFIFTGLVFPAYVMLMMARSRLGRPAASEWTLAVVILALAPFAALGFLGGYEWLLLVPCIALVISLFIGERGGAPMDQMRPGLAPAPLSPTG